MMTPDLQKFQQAFTEPGAQGWAHEAAIRLNDYVQKRRVAENNIQAGNDLVNHLDTFKNGLVQMVRSDPHAVHTALDLVDPTLRDVIGSMPNQPANADAHHSALSAHIQHEIATAAVTSLAERHEGQARDLLADKRISDALPPESQQALGTYIDMHARARAIDDRMAQQQNRKDQVRAADGAAYHYLSSLIDPQTEALNFPPGWNQSLLSDPRLPPGHKVALSTLYNRLAISGDAKSSDPFLSSQIIASAAQQRPMSFPDVIQHAGDRLTVPDALWLSTHSRPVTPEDHANVRAAHGVLQQAQQTLMGQDGEHGAAGATAYGRFVNWALPQIRRGASLNPANQDYLFNQGAIHSFLPTGDDLPKRTPDNRPPLSEIFGKARA